MGIYVVDGFNLNNPLRIYSVGIFCLIRPSVSMGSKI